ncbi:MAG: histidine kinase [Actinomycetota bacterium]|nr:histidine kinase [Actinomycetota bacterium]
MRTPPRALDLGLAAVSAALTTAVLVGVGQLAASDGTAAGARWWTAPLLLLPSAALLLLRRNRPVATIYGVWVPIALHALVTGQGGEGLYLVWPAWVSLYALAAYGSRRQLLAGLGVAVVALAVHDWNDPRAWRAGSEAALSALWWDLVVFVAPLVGGLVAGARRARTLATEKALVEAEARAAVAEERTRITRELHDVVTHHVNLVVLQAAAASALLDRDPGRVHRPLQVIEDSGREALAEMRRLLGVLRDEDVDRPLHPQAGVEDLGGLVGTARAAGLDAGLTITGTPRRLPAGLALTVYRIVQESLTNAARYAAGARVGVRLHYEPRAVDVAVVDDGSVGVGGTVPAGGRRGLLGMRERVALFAGTLEAGPAPDGGFAVHARLPVPADAS